MQSSTKFIALSGRATPVDDREKLARLWKAEWKDQHRLSTPPMSSGQLFAKRIQAGTSCGQDEKLIEAILGDSFQSAFQLLGFCSEPSRQDSYDIFTPAVRDQFVNHR